MKLLITGSKGQLGSQIINVLGTKAKSDKIVYLALGSKELDITDFSKVRDNIKNFKPDVIINCAAYNQVDDCENNEDYAYKVNALGARNLAIVADEVNAKIMHLSTDYVFNGDNKTPYKEYDTALPINVYGKTKLKGEEYVRNFNNKYFIIRTSWMFSSYGNNFVKTILNLAKDKPQMEIVNDQIGTPTNAEDLVKHILKLIETEEYGTYHCSCNGECSWYDFAKKIIEYSGIKCKVIPTTSVKLKRKAGRPTFSALDNMMLRCTVGDEMQHWEEALKKFINRI